GSGGRALPADGASSLADDVEEGARDEPEDDRQHAGDREPAPQEPAMRGRLGPGGRGGRGTGGHSPGGGEDGGRRRRDGGHERGAGGAGTVGRIRDGLAKKPGVGGMPVSESRNSVMRIASHGSRRPRPANVSRPDVTPARRWIAATTAKAPRFITEYAAP